MSEINNPSDSLTTADSGDSGSTPENQVISTCQDPQTIVLAPLIRIVVDFNGRTVTVTQNGEPLGNAQVPASVNELVMELRPFCSIPVPGRHPEGEG